MIAYLYGLTDPITNKIRYIGYTTKKLIKRKQQHINGCKIKDLNCHRCKWINKLAKDNLKPEIKLLFTVPFEKVKDLEIELIKHYKQFSKLTNNTNGGDGTIGLKPSEETRNKMRLRMLGKPNIYVRKKIKLTEISTGKEIIFLSAKEASLYLNCNPESIKNVCRKYRSKTIYNHYADYIK